MGVLHGGGDRRRRRSSFGVNVGHHIVTNMDFVHGVVILCHGGWRRGSSQIILAYLVVVCSTFLTLHLLMLITVTSSETKSWAGYFCAGFWRPLGGNFHADLSILVAQ